MTVTNLTPSKPVRVGGPHDTPAMRQFHSFKEQHPGCVLFFRMGDFYEMFYDDAHLAHKVLGVTLTQRTQGIPMAGVPYHSVEGYLRRMIQAGYRVAVCDQVEDPSQAKGVVRRAVTRVVTPGTLTDESLLDEGRENPLAAVQFHGDGCASIAWAELSTGAFSLATVAADELADELTRIAPSELLYPESVNDDGAFPATLEASAGSIGCAKTGRAPWQFRQSEAVEVLCRQFQVATLDGFGLTRDDPALGAACAVVYYLLETQTPGTATEDSSSHDVRRIGHLQPPRRFERSDHLVIDQTSLRSLEVERTLRSGGVEGSLLGVLQGCVTAMGKRQLRQWLCYPLCRIKPIHLRQRVVGALVEDPRLLGELRRELGGVQDIERIVGRIAVGRATPRDLIGLGASAGRADALVALLADRPMVSDRHARLIDIADHVTALSQRILAACVDTPPAHLREGGLIRDGYDGLLDEYRGLRDDSHTWLAGYQKQLVEQSGIATLKIGFNKVFGYYIEVTAANKDRAPQEWTRRQTLKNAERYTTVELKQFEGKALDAQGKAVAREQELFAELCAHAQAQLEPLGRFAQVVAELDVLACFAKCAVDRRYVCPDLVEQPVLEIHAGRHPVLDRLLADQFVPNDLSLGGSGEGDSGSGDPDGGSTLALITGPNMAGKSTYIRQAALITLMAHAGSFVPADAATIGLCDRIFTRIGASDELHTGRSTFMVEMTETANICHHATASSLVILDEIGRGTSTLDGLSLAWAIAEHLARRHCRSLFATHYHELTGLAGRFEQVTNLHVTVRDWDGQVVFLHRIEAGATDRSYGIHVAKIAGLPSGVIARADELLGQLSVSHSTAAGVLAGVGGHTAGPEVKGMPDLPPDAGGAQALLFRPDDQHPALTALREADLNNLTPIDAFDLLRRLRGQVDATDG